jgi:acyl-coenzyme A thioesterase PaaI-like protein
VPVTSGATYEVEAHNTATRSDNRIHDDEVARRFGFVGGLVPGVDVYAYLTQLPVARWGLAWLERGTIEARFIRPVYDGQRVTVQAERSPAGAAGDAGMELQVVDGAGVVCAAATATLPEQAPEQPEAGRWPVREQLADPPPASPETLAPGTVFGLRPHRFLAERASEYLAEIRERLGLYEAERVAHPGWLLRDANHVLAGNVVLGPWIHVSSSVQHFRPARDGDLVAARAVVEREWEHKGHRFVELDVGLFAGDDLAVRVAHTAIHQPRQVRTVSG